ncbi:MAG TPA: hypothetical protein VMY35_05980 [Phycisphaerae bacterium]|nr:hypothetical protein [Phycisphaerae bacterium]
MNEQERDLRAAMGQGWIRGLVVGVSIGLFALLILLVLVVASRRARGSVCETTSDAASGRVNPQSAIRNPQSTSLLDAGVPEQPRRDAKAGSMARVSLRPRRPAYTGWRRLEYSVLDGIWSVETERGRNLRRGDGGKAAGHVQFHEAAWYRGCEYLGVDWLWPEDAYEVEKCFHVARANWYRDHMPCVVAGDVDELIRRFRRPFDPYGPGQAGYVRRVRAAMAEPQRAVGQ